jgi:hypothetical protein
VRTNRLLRSFESTEGSNPSERAVKPGQNAWSNRQSELVVCVPAQLRQSVSVYLAKIWGFARLGPRRIACIKKPLTGCSAISKPRAGSRRPPPDRAAPWVAESLTNARDAQAVCSVSVRSDMRRKVSKAEARPPMLEVPDASYAVAGEERVVEPAQRRTS